MKTGVYRSLVTAALVVAFGFGQPVADPWAKSDLLEPADLASVLRSASAKKPEIVCVAFPVLYRNKHIQHAIFAGPGSREVGIEALKKAVAGMAKDSDIVLYCGCCPMEKCPNLRPAYRTLKELGYKNVRVLNIPTNMHTDWFSKDYPSEAGSAANPAGL